MQQNIEGECWIASSEQTLAEPDECDDTEYRAVEAWHRARNLRLGCNRSDHDIPIKMRCDSATVCFQVVCTSNRLHRQRISVRPRIAESANSKSPPEREDDAGAIGSLDEIGILRS